MKLPGCAARDPSIFHPLQYPLARGADRRPSGRGAVVLAPRAAALRGPAAAVSAQTSCTWPPCAPRRADRRRLPRTARGRPRRRRHEPLLLERDGRTRTRTTGRCGGAGGARHRDARPAGLRADLALRRMCGCDAAQQVDDVARDLGHDCGRVSCCGHSAGRRGSPCPCRAASAVSAERSSRRRLAGPLGLGDLGVGQLLPTPASSFASAGGARRRDSSSCVKPRERAGRRRSAAPYARVAVELDDRAPAARACAAARRSRAERVRVGGLRRPAAASPSLPGAHVERDAAAQRVGAEGRRAARRPARSGAGGGPAGA